MHALVPQPRLTPAVRNFRGVAPRALVAIAPRRHRHLWKQMHMWPGMPPHVCLGIAATLTAFGALVAIAGQLF